MHGISQLSWGAFRHLGSLVASHCSVEQSEGGNHSVSWPDYRVSISSEGLRRGDKMTVRNPHFLSNKLLNLLSRYASHLDLLRILFENFSLKFLEAAQILTYFTSWKCFGWKCFEEDVPEDLLGEMSLCDLKEKIPEGLKMLRNILRFFRFENFNHFIGNFVRWKF